MQFTLRAGLSDGTVLIEAYPEDFKDDIMALLRPEGC